MRRRARDHRGYRVSSAPRFRGARTLRENRISHFLTDLVRTFMFYTRGYVLYVHKSITIYYCYYRDTLGVYVVFSSPDMIENSRISRGH